TLIGLILSIFYGLNFVYLEETGTGIWYWFTVAGIGIWYIVNFFRVPGMVKNYNSALAIKIVAEVRPVSDKPEF
ncbi:MAG: hypothetical protein Q8O43_01780, partial [Dehalococcoidia bacterium]|nr:hypothetical protein [Dehalococcoidia bacterium]